MANRGELRGAVFTEVHRSRHLIACDCAFKAVAQRRAFKTLAAPKIHFRAVDPAAEVPFDVFAYVSSLQLIALLLEHQDMICGAVYEVEVSIPATADIDRS